MKRTTIIAIGLCLIMLTTVGVAIGTVAHSNSANILIVRSFSFIVHLIDLVTAPLVLCRVKRVPMCVSTINLGVI